MEFPHCCVVFVTTFLSHSYCIQGSFLWHLVMVEAPVDFKGIVESLQHSSKLWQPLVCHLRVNSMHMVRIR